MRSTITSTWICVSPAMICSPVWLSRWKSIVGSSSCSRRSAAPIFSSSTRALASIANAITGLGIGGSSSAISASWAASTSPAWVSLSLATAPMSPGPNSLACSESLPCGISSWPTRSLW